MTKPLLALDCDQVITDYVSGFTAFVIKHGYGLNLDNDFSSYDISTYFNGLSRNKCRDLIVKYNDTESPPVYGYLKNVIPALLQKYDIVIVTSHGGGDYTRKQRLDMLLSLGFTDVFILGLGENKQGILEELKPDIFIDDNPEQLLAGINAGVEQVIALEYPYNRDWVDGYNRNRSIGDKKRIKSIKSLKEII